jgi:hypothetical protein
MDTGSMSRVIREHASGSGRPAKPAAGLLCLIMDNARIGVPGSSAGRIPFETECSLAIEPRDR